MSSKMESLDMPKKARKIGSLFSRDRKSSLEKKKKNDDLSSFFHGTTTSSDVPADHCQTIPRALTLARLDTSVPRYPQALDIAHQVQQQPATASNHFAGQSGALKSHHPRKGLCVCFTDSPPEIIGEGGDEHLEPTAQIGQRRKSQKTLQQTQQQKSGNIGDNRPVDAALAAKSPHRLQSDHPSPTTPIGAQLDPTSPVGDSLLAPRVPNSRAIEKRKSYIEMREAEGSVLRARRDGPDRDDSSSSPNSDDGENPRQLPLHPRQQTSSSPKRASPPQPVGPDYHPYRKPLPQRPSSAGDTSPQTLHPSPTTVPRQTHRSPRYDVTKPDESQQNSPALGRRSTLKVESPSTVPNSPSLRPSRRPQLEKTPSSSAALDQLYAHYRQGSYESATPTNQHGGAVSDGQIAINTEALDLFVRCTRHLFELFRLHAETWKPLSATKPQEMARAGLWWFLKGRMALESILRERAAAKAEDADKDELARQQAYADLVKSYWIFEEILPEVTAGGATDPDISETRRAVFSSLRKLSISMRRNDIFPLEEPFLPQLIDKNIWVSYPTLSQDIVMLLRGFGKIALTSEETASPLTMLEAMPLGDTTQFFSFGRVPMDVFLMTQDMDSQRYHFPCLASMVRPQKVTSLILVIASQNGDVQLRISASKDSCPSWDDVRWRPDTCNLDIKLPRGFVLVARCTQKDYNVLSTLYDAAAKVKTSLKPRSDETAIFRSTLQEFQYLDNDSAWKFPKEPVPACEIAVFEKIHKEGAPTGPRYFHRGYRIAVASGPRCKVVSGVNQAFVPQSPVLYGLLRGGGQKWPALSMRLDQGNLRGDMIMCFTAQEERNHLHELLTAVALQNDEQVFVSAPMLPDNGFEISQTLYDPIGLPILKKLRWKKASIINDEGDGDQPSCVLSAKMRVVVEAEYACMTDRINVEPGELRMRLDVNDKMALMVYRLPQSDITFALEEARFGREMSPELSKALDFMKKNPSVRTYRFMSLESLHNFQYGLTGFKVVFDDVAAGFGIARRRMVVPIHKKWEAGLTRIQIVHQEERNILQLLAFFEEFSHGECMGFVLKETDVFEGFVRGTRRGVKMVDAKFPLPRPVEEVGAQQTESAFVCLDMPELPGEHDDISIGFDDDTVYQAFVRCLPGPVKEPRMSSLAKLTK